MLIIFLPEQFTATYLLNNIHNFFNNYLLCNLIEQNYLLNYLLANCYLSALRFIYIVIYLSIVLLLLQKKIHSFAIGRFIYSAHYWGQNWVRHDLNHAQFGGACTRLPTYVILGAYASPSVFEQVGKKVKNNLFIFYLMNLLKIIF